MNIKEAVGMVENVAQIEQACIQAKQVLKEVEEKAWVTDRIKYALDILKNECGVEIESVSKTLDTLIYAYEKRDLETGQTINSIAWPSLATVNWPSDFFEDYKARCNSNGVPNGGLPYWLALAMVNHWNRSTGSFVYSIVS
jgi:hypothetical protein